MAPPRLSDADLTANVLQLVRDEFAPRLDALQQHVDSTATNLETIMGSVNALHAQLIPAAPTLPPTTAAAPTTAPTTTTAAPTTTVPPPPPELTAVTQTVFHSNEARIHAFTAYVRDQTAAGEDILRQANGLNLNKVHNKINLVSSKRQSIELKALAACSKHAREMADSMTVEDQAPFLHSVLEIFESKFSDAAQQADFTASIASKSDIYGNKFGEFARGSLIGNYDGDYSHAADALADAAKACKLTASGDSRPFDRYDRNPSQRAPNNGKKRAAGDPRRSRSRSR